MWAQRIAEAGEYSFEVIRISRNEHTVFLSYKWPGSVFSDRIGWVRLEKNYWRYYETHSSLDHLFRAKGLGVLLYSYAINFGIERDWRVRSSLSPSAHAIRLWRSKRLNQIFNIVERRGRFVVISKR